MSGGLRTALGLARSLVIYRARPWRIRALARFYADFVRPGDLAFDIGAHVGNRTLALRRAGAHVVALEPQAALHAFLRATLPRDVTLLPLAAGPAAGRARLAVSRLHPTVSSLRGDFAAAVGSDAAFAGVDWDGSEEVATTTLDALIAEHGPPRFVKIDVEGYEPEVLAGLSRPVPAVAFEYLPADLAPALACLRRLAALGPYRFNVVEGERSRFALDGWVDAVTMAERLEARPGGSAGGRPGDIYGRLAAEG